MLVAQTRLSYLPPQLTIQPPIFTSFCLCFHLTTTVFSFLGIRTSSKTTLSFPLLHFFPSVSFSPSFCSDERQALSRQWHSKTSGLGSSVSGYSTLLGAISLSKVRPAHSPTENPQISYYKSPHRGETQLLREYLYVCKVKNRGEQTRGNLHTRMSKKCMWGEGKWRAAAACAADLWVGLMLTWLHRLKVSTQRGQAQSQTPKLCSPPAALKIKLDRRWFCTRYAATDVCRPLPSRLRTQSRR